MKYCVLSVCVFTLVCCSKEEAAETTTSAVNITTVLEPSSSTAADHDHQPTSSANPLQSVLRSSRLNRTRDSRMRAFESGPSATTSTTASPVTEFNYWWFFTTPRRPFISYRDYPGKPGVATWKEISPAVVKESKTKKTDPTAAGVSSMATRWRLSLFVALLAAFARA